MEQKARLFPLVEQMAQAGAFASVEHALDVLCAFVDKEELGVSELSRQFGLHKSGVHRILRALRSRGFIEQNASRRYSLGIRVLELGNAYRLRLDLLRKAEPLLRELSRSVNANAHLASLEQGEVLDLVRVEYPAPLRVSRTPILRRPAHCTALGKALLAFGPPERVRRAIAGGLPRLTRRTVTDPDRLLRALERIRERGYAIDNEEFYPGIRCVAAPVFNESGDALAAVSVSGLVTQVTEDRVAALTLQVVHTARQLSLQMGYQQ